MLNKVCRDVTVLDTAPVGQSTEGGEFFELTLEHPGWQGWRPGQFVMLTMDGFAPELTWGRPFSICRCDETSLSLFIQKVGRGTTRLAALKPGATVTLWGPLGNSFLVDESAPTLLLAGGVGLAPFIGYAEAHPKPENLELVFAHRLPLDCYPFGRLPEPVRTSCLQERTLDDLPAVIAAVQAKVRENADGLVLCCGPTPFMRTVAEAALACGTRCQVSLENRMACGVGACLGCVARTPKGEMVQVCTRGPVFNASEVEL